ncbi:MAG: type IX secretion system outer membrane channel protein PorV [Flavobacteriales bacterium]|nr:type IX secretion system outer membrane channel protein PorV [Flavobacteriales bacterium]
MHVKQIIAISTLSTIGLSAMGQSTNAPTGDYKVDYKNKTIINPITTAVPFLGISPDARAGGMGDLGVATRPDNASMHWNLAKAPFQERATSIGISYSPWLRALIPDVNLAYVGFSQKIKDFGAVSASLRYFSLGNVTFTDVSGGVIGNYNPNEFALDAGYSMKLIDKLSMGVAFRFIYSNLTLGQSVGGVSTKPGLAGAGDISLYYENRDWKIAKMPVVFRWGTAFTNIGSKIKYTTTQARADFIPMNLRFGPSLDMQLDQEGLHTLMVAVEINKLLVPTNPSFERDSSGFIIVDTQGNPVIEFGQSPNRSVIGGMFTSFADAPGGVREEFHEYNIAFGMEYWYNRIFAVRAGYFNEARQKGNRKYFTMGVGLRYSVFGFDFSYLVPVVSRNPLENTIRFTLAFDFDKLSTMGKEGSKPLPGRKK